MMEREEQKKTILIADDSELNREMLSEILGDKYRYLYAPDGEKALELLSENIQIDILLLDMNMPNISGMEVLRIMKEHRWTEEIPVVIISAEDDMGYIQNAYSFGAVDYIVRPLNAFLVQHRVENTLMLYSQNKRLVKLVESQVFQREKINNMLINIFSRVVEVGNRESGSHTLRVQTITNLLLNRLVKITDKYPLTETDIALISSVSALHDIGKIFIPDEILNKPGRLNEEEWKIMKSHTVRGDEFLWEMPIDQEEKLMQVAHDICRYHHERFDGRGYPDGLEGEAIPVSAQVVSLADVYDALTSERCYKQAFSHEEASAMILRGECGTFNPLLLQAFTDIGDELMLRLQVNAKEHDYMNNTQALANEAMESENLFLSNRSGYLMECEISKKEFFAEQCGGIQFEYDAIMGRVIYLNYYNAEGEKIPLSSSNTYLLREQDWDSLREQVRESTRENPTVTMKVNIPIRDEMRWYRLTVRSIWSKDNDGYVALVGQFTDIHDKIQNTEEIPVQKETATRENHISARNIFEAVRIANPEIGFLPDSITLQNFYKDGLTSAYSRAYLEMFRENLEQAEGIAVLDLNQFKKVNDTFGHIAGDRALRQTVVAVRSCIREEDVMIRYGGDEFLLIFQKIPEEAFFEKLKEIKRRVAQARVVGYPELRLGISVGGAHRVYPLTEAIDTADKAMYRDKFHIQEQEK